MNVLCLYKWDEKRAKQLESWVKAHEQRFVLFLEDDPAQVIWNPPHPRIRCFTLPQQNRRETFEKIAWEFLYLPFTFEPAENPILKEFADIQSEIGYRAFDFADQGFQLLQNFRGHLSQPTHLAKDLYGKFTNIPAIVCGGGPSLTKSVKQFQDKALILGCGAGVEALLKMGVQPDFAAHVDSAPLHRFTAAEIPLFYQLRTNAAVAAKYKGSHFLVSGAGNFPLESWLQKQCGLEEVLDGGWTVGTFGVAIAVALGCNPIILAGIDLAALPDQLYAPGVKTSATTDGFLPMKNREGRSVLSRADWILAAEWLDQFAKKHSDRRWGTLSRSGLDISSIPLISLEERNFTTELTENTEKGKIFDRLCVLCGKIPLSQLYEDGTIVWQKVAISIQRCQEICQKILQEMEKIFPQHPLEHSISALLEHDLSEELAFQQVLDPLWGYWRHVIERHNSSGEVGLYLNRILFFQSICEKF